MRYLTRQILVKNPKDRKYNGSCQRKGSGGSSCLTGRGFQFYKMKKLWGRFSGAIQ